jgi:asparagine synthase (glutamine-hydrolysing)
LMGGRLPSSVLTRSKVGFDIPAHRWLRAELKPLLMDTLSPSAVCRFGLFNPATVENLINSHMERTANLGYHLWGLMTLFLWLERWNVNTLASPEPANTSTVRALATSS